MTASRSGCSGSKINKLSSRIIFRNPNKLSEKELEVTTNLSLGSSEEEYVSGNGWDYILEWGETDSEEDIQDENESRSIAALEIDTTQKGRSESVNAHLKLT